MNMDNDEIIDKYIRKPISNGFIIYKEDATSALNEARASERAELLKPTNKRARKRK